MEIWQFILTKLEASINVMLLYVLESEGSSPGRQGFKMAVAADGNFNGTIGGGIMEHKLVEKARQMLIDKGDSIELMWQYHDKQQSIDQSGMICSGSQLNAFVPLNPTDKQLIEYITEGLHKTIIITPKGFQLLDTIPNVSLIEFEFHDESNWVYKEQLNKKPVIHIIGGGHVSLALSELMKFLGFYVDVYDERVGLNTMDQNRFADEKHVIESYDRLSDHLKTSAEDFVVIITFGYRTDKVALKQLLGKPNAYLGLIGSDKKIETLFDELVAEGISKDQLNKIFAPVGINIFSKTAPEIAVSIAAEIIREKNKGLPTGRRDSFE